MPRLANNDVAGLFTVPAEDWKAINKRVGAVMSVAVIEKEITAYLPAYPDLKANSTLWQINIFPGLITESKSLAEYAAKAVTTFSDLNKTVKELDRSKDVPLPLQLYTRACLDQLRKDTTFLSQSFGVLSRLLAGFLNDNKLVDHQMEQNRDKLDVFWKPLGAVIAAVERGAGKVTSVWDAINDDLQHAITEPVNITRPFIESLNLDAAINSWKTVQAEAGAFATRVDGQAKYWFDPFQD